MKQETQPKKTTPVAAFFSLPDDVLAVLCRLRDAGHESYLVGGCVRDILRGHTPKDFDITTSATPDEIHKAYAGLRMIDTGIAHGTVTVIYEKKPYEITTYRVDGDYHDSRHPDAVRFTPDLFEDLARRDFTMNALAYHPDEGIYDDFGGIGDIRERKIRAVGEPARRFEEDALRILRALRFASVLGFKIDKATSTAARAQANGLLAISAERVREELVKLLCGDHAATVLVEYADILGVRLSLWYAALASFGGIEKLAAPFPYLPADPALRLCAFLLPLAGEEGLVTAKAALEGLRFDHRTRDRALKLLSHIDTPFATDERALRRFTAGLGGRDALLLLSLHTGVARAAGNTERERLIEQAKQGVEKLIHDGLCSSIAELAVGGDDLISIGFPKGKAVGDMLRRLLDAVLDGAVKNEKEALLSLARAYLP